MNGDLVKLNDATRENVIDNNIDFETVIAIMITKSILLNLFK